MGKGVQEYGIQCAGSSIHGLLDDLNDIRQVENSIIGYFPAVQIFQDTFRTAFQANATVSIADYGIISCYFGFGRDDTLKPRAQGFLQSCRVDCTSSVVSLLIRE